MVYIYKKTIGEKNYYYLRASQRKGAKVIVKDIAYLGGTIEEVKKALENLPKYSNEIRKAYKTINNFLESNRYLEKIKLSKLKKDRFIDYEKLLELEACKLHFSTDFKKNNELTKKEILKNFIIEFAHNTTSIEGNTINLNEARSLLQDGLTPKNKTLREIYDLQNTERVFLKLINSREDINHEFIQNIHSELMKNIDARSGYRTSDVRVIKANFKATPAPYVKTDMELLLKWFNDNKNKLHPLVIASVLHHKFEKIHPFMDGNGRTGRMLLNFILMKSNYPPLIILNKERKEYLDALRKADKLNLNEIDEAYKELINFNSDQMIKNYWNIFL
ncbi:MAG: Filamentation induced by cAMP protein Fic [archaeon GW2011_AR20]|nr:MAG: Filamentation induced by cAMP protein Fic [archaeon GW2011_AR20]MBS3160172.1 Fic family protein [Candidatus Woesearchaeota archaeon]